MAPARRKLTVPAALAVVAIATGCTSNPPRNDARVADSHVADAEKPDAMRDAGIHDAAPSDSPLG